MDWELDPLAGLLGLLDSVSLSNSPDRRIWLADSSGSFCCELARYLWSRLFSIVGKTWFGDTCFADFLQIDVEGFGRDKEWRILWRCANFAVLWVLW